MSQVCKSYRLKGKFSVAGALLLGIFSLGMKSDPNHLIRVKFRNYFGNEVLKFDSVQYKNELGQSLTISKFRYYIANISLRSLSGKDFKQNGYWLLDASEPDNCQIDLKGVPEGKYISISFTIGVDSVDNCSGAQDGALDPVNAMFWTWNTGYIFLKLEGVAPVSTSPGHIFEFHIGGYKSPNNCVRRVTISTDPVAMVSSADASCTLDLKVDASELMKTPTTIDLSSMSSVTGPQNATTIADNYSDMFRLITVENGK